MKSPLVGARRLLASSLPLALLLGVASAQTAIQPRSATAEPWASGPVAAPSPEVLNLRRDLEQIVRASGWPNAQWGVIVVSVDRGDTLFSVNPDRPLAPASNMKLFSTAAALYYLGPDFRYSTYALGTGPIREGVLDGDLILFGTGDPSVSRRMGEGSGTPLETLADSLRAHGVTAVSGDVVGDGSYFDDAWLGEGWRPEYRMASYSAPIGALSFAENLVSVTVLPGRGAGQPARIRTLPETQGLAIANRVRTVTSGNTSVRFEHEEAGLAVTGQIRTVHPGVVRSVPVVDPANYAAAAFRSVLEQRGITVGGTVRTVRDPGASPVAMSSTAPTAENGHGAPRVLAVHLSPTMLEIAEVTNHISQNMYAEALMKTVGRVAIGEGSFAAGARAIQYFLECEAAVDSTMLRVVDGSGLSRLNQVTPRAIAHLLSYMAHSDMAEHFEGTLPQAAGPHDLRHSLRTRMARTPAALNARAKTGTIDRVSALSGYVRSADGERLLFSIIVNDSPATWRAKTVEDQLVIRLAEFSRAGD